jgi:hypothetical protein
VKEEISRLFRDEIEQVPEDAGLQELAGLVLRFRGKTPSGEEIIIPWKTFEFPIPKELYDSLDRVWVVLDGLLSKRPDLRAIYPELVQLETFLINAGCVESLTRRRGRPPKNRARVRRVAAEVLRTLERMGHTRRLSPTNPYGPVPIITAGILGLIDGKIHTPEGVVSALRVRDRSKTVRTHGQNRPDRFRFWHLDGGQPNRQVRSQGEMRRLESKGPRNAETSCRDD